jgi:hypothetical protein
MNWALYLSENRIAQSLALQQGFDFHGLHHAMRGLAVYRLAIDRRMKCMETGLVTCPYKVHGVMSARVATGLPN